MSPTRKKAELVKVAAALPIRPQLPDDSAPPLENIPPHKALAVATKRHAKLTEELRTLKADFATENIRASGPAAFGLFAFQAIDKE
jgi:hypothetical protein